MFKLLTFCFSLMVFYQCKTTNEMVHQQQYSVQDFFRQRICYAECGATSPCEGKKIKLIGQADLANIYEKENRFFLTDSEKPKYFIPCKVDLNQNDEWVQAIKKSEVLVVEGKIRSYDAGTNYTCRKNYELTEVHIEF